MAKRQNHISAHDMFLLVTYIMDKYPEITEITSIKKTKLESLGNREAKNTNVLLYNIPGAVGLKTGTTSKAQSCLVSAVERRDKDDNIHYVVAIVFGAENAYAQNYTSYLLLNYGIGIFNTYELGIVLNKKNTNIVPDSLEKMIITVLNVARQKK